VKTHKTGPMKRVFLLGVTLLFLLPLLSCRNFHETVIYKEANALYNEEKYVEAIAKYEELAKTDVFKKDAWLHLGYCYLSLLRSALNEEEVSKYSEQAIQAFKEYLKLAPEDRKVEDYIFNTYVDARNYDKVLEFLFEKFQKDPKDIRAIQLIIQTYEDQGKITEAGEWYGKWLEASPDDANAYYAFAVFYWRNSYYNMGLEASFRATMVDQGIDLLKKAVELKPDFAEAYIYWNLLLREKITKYVTNKREQERLTEEAKKYQEKGQQLMLEQQAKKAAAESQAGAAAPGSGQAANTSSPGTPAKTTQSP
jgi:tetratricopeptide (TPR) repeat protein